MQLERYRPFEVPELPAPEGMGAWRKLDIGGDGSPRPGDVSAQVPVANVDEYIDRELAVFSSYGCRSSSELTCATSPRRTVPRLALRPVPPERCLAVGRPLLD